MGNDNKVKNILLTVLTVGLVSMTIAFAALTQQLNISDNQVTITTDWNVHFVRSATATSAAATSAWGSALTANITQQPELTDTTISGLRATFQKPGDKVEFYFDVVNDGSIDATLSSATYTTPTCTSSDNSVTSQTLSTFCTNSINYSIIDLDTGYAPNENDDLLAAPGDPSVRHWLLTVELDENTQSIPSGTITVSNIGATFVYTQK